MALDKQEGVEQYVGRTVAITLRHGGVDLVPHTLRDVFLTEDEAVELAQVILRRYDVAVVAA